MISYAPFLRKNVVTFTLFLSLWLIQGCGGSDALYSVSTIDSDAPQQSDYSDEVDESSSQESSQDPDSSSTPPSQTPTQPPKKYILMVDSGFGAGKVCGQYRGGRDAGEFPYFFCRVCTGKSGTDCSAPKNCNTLPSKWQSSVAEYCTSHCTSKKYTVVFGDLNSSDFPIYSYFCK